MGYPYNNGLPVDGEEVTIQRTSDGALFFAVCHYVVPDGSERYWTLSLPDADTTIAEADVDTWWRVT